MPVFKDEARGTWYVMVRYQDWTGERKQKCKRGFATKREAQEWERSFQMQTSGDLDMTFEAFTELYIYLFLLYVIDGSGCSNQEDGSWNFLWFGNRRDR